MQFTISLAQMHIQFGRPDSNLKKAVQFIEEAARQSHRMILLPELWSSGYDLQNAASHAAQTPELLLELQQLARTHKICIGGSLLEPRPDGIYNTFTWIDPDFSDPIFYRKIHLFRLMEEDQWLRAGNFPTTVAAPWGQGGLAICYDLRFPELFRKYALEGATSIILSAEWPLRRIEHWKILLKARAIENQIYMFAVNCVGISPKDRFGGSSTIITPWGETLAEGSHSDEMLVQAVCETDLVDQARSFMPVFQDRRPDVYAS